MSAGRDGGRESGLTNDPGAEGGGVDGESVEDDQGVGQAGRDDGHPHKELLEAKGYSLLDADDKERQRGEEEESEEKAAPPQETLGEGGQQKPGDLEAAPGALGEG